MNDPTDGFVERFAALLAEAGMPRMAARVFVALLSRDDGAATAADLTDQLRASSGAVSGAVNYLGRVGLIDREQLSGSRKDYYRVRPDVWYEVTLSQQPRYTRWNAALAEGIEAVGSTSVAGRRLSETAEFFAFLQREMPALIERWHASRNGR